MLLLFSFAVRKTIKSLECQFVMKFCVFFLFHFILRKTKVFFESEQKCVSKLILHLPRV